MTNKTIYEREFTGKTHEDGEYGHLWVTSPGDDKYSIAVVDQNFEYKDFPEFEAPTLLEENKTYKVKITIEECEQPKKESQL